MQKFLNTELGRSLVEMLGVLAIIGVLSIASIAGYSYAVTKWKALDTLDEVATRAIEYDRQLALIRDWKPGDEFDNYDLGDTTSLGYGISGFVSEEDNYFEIEVTGVPIEVCRQLARELEGVTYGPIVSMTVGEADFGTEIECVENARVAFLIGPDWETYASNNEATASTSTTPVTGTPESTTPHTGTGTQIGDPCSSNDNCLTNQFCNLNTEFVGGTCGHFSKGQCKTLSFREEKILGRSYFLSDESMSYWAAQKFCERKGGVMFSLSDLGGQINEYGAYVPTNSEKEQKLMAAFEGEFVWGSDKFSSWGECPYTQIYIGNAVTGEGTASSSQDHSLKALCHVL